MERHHCQLLIAVLAISALGFIAGCERAGEATPTPLPVPTVQTVYPHRGEITRSITLPGNVLAYQGVTLYAKVPGYLKTITVDKGDQVKEGELLADIEVPELIADRARYKAEVEVAAIDYKRVSAAQKKAPDLVVPQTVDDAKGRLDIAKANLERIETLLSYAKITAPFSGMVTRRLVDPGAFIPAATSGSAAQNAALLTLMDFSKVRVQVSVPETEVPFITKGLPVTVTVEELAGRRFTGTVTRYAGALDEATKTMLTEIEMPNPKGELRPGMYATIKIELERKTNALLLSADALIVEKTKTSVFTVTENKAHKVPVKIGFNDGASAEILEGLALDQPVILAGKESIQDGQAVNSVEFK
jgi:membrane fusion protein, multidrug efflux system